MPGELPPWLDGGREHEGPLPEPRAPLGSRGAVAAAAACMAAGVAVAGLVLTGSRHAPPPAHAPSVRPAAGNTAALPPAASGAASSSTAGPPAAAPGPVPYPLLIADEGNHRVVEVTPDKRLMWQYAVGASSAEFGADGAQVAVTDEDAGSVSVIDYAIKRPVWSYSTGLDHPYGAHLLPGGNAVVADVRNCRVLTLTPAPAIAATWGAPQRGVCQTDLAAGRLAYPNGAVPQADGSVLVTLSGSGDIALFGAGGKVLWSVQAPPLHGDIASAAELTPSGNVLVTAMGTPGTVMSFDPQTRTVYWDHYVTSGSGELADPRQATVLASGDVAVADSGNDRVVVIDPNTDQIVWQYGGAGVLKHPTSVAQDRWHAAAASAAPSP